MFYSQKKPKNDPSIKRLRQNTRIDIPSEDEIKRSHEQKLSQSQQPGGPFQRKAREDKPSTSSVSAGLRGLSIINEHGEHYVQESKFLGAKVKENVQYIVIGNPEFLSGPGGSTPQELIQKHLASHQEKDKAHRSRTNSFGGAGGHGDTTTSQLRNDVMTAGLGGSMRQGGDKTLDQVSTFAADKVIGKGSFGVVYQARNLDLKEVVAIKKVYQDRRFKNRELQIMRHIKHPNIVELKNYYFSTSSNKDVYLNMILEYVPDSLFKATQSYVDKSTDKINVPISVVKLYTFQLLRSLAYIHTRNICHRDIKPQNVLVNAVNGECKLCDFGSAKQLVKGEENIAYICSRYYRAPELVFGATTYTTAIDVWSVGCVMAEMIIGRPLFAGETGVDQLVEIIKILGTPTKQQINLMNPNYKEMKFPQVKGSSLPKYLKNKTTPEAIDLLEKMLQYSPKDRITAAEAMCHPFFDDLVQRVIDLPLSMALPDVCNWLPGELDSFPKDVKDRLAGYKMRI